MLEKEPVAEPELAVGLEQVAGPEPVVGLEPAAGKEPVVGKAVPEAPQAGNSVASES